MSEITDFYMDWLGCSAFGSVGKRGVQEAPPVVFQPTDLSDCSIWLDATDNLTVTTAGGSPTVVTSWSNKGLFGGQANSNDGSVYYTTHTINGLNVMNFSPYSDLLFNWTQPDNPVTVFVVMKPITDLADPGVTYPFMNFFDALSGVYNMGTSMYYDSGLTSFGYGIGANNLGIWVLGYNATNPTNIPLSITLRNDTTVNNTLIVNDTVQTLSYNDTAAYNLSNFTYYMGNPVHGTDFDMAEFIVYTRALSDLEIAEVNSYLTSKYNITAL